MMITSIRRWVPIALFLLLLGSSNSIEAAESPGFSVVRSRNVRADSGAILRADHAGARLPLKLFDDLSLTAVLEHAQAVEFNGSVWQGRVEGVADSLVLLSVVGKHIVGSVEAGGKIYRIRYAGKGLHRIEELERHDDLFFNDVVTSVPELPDLEDSDDLSTFAALSENSQAPTVIDVLVVYTRAARKALNGKKAIQADANLSIAFLHYIYKQQDIRVRYRVVGVKAVSYKEGPSIHSDLAALTAGREGLAKAHQLREQFGADIVSLYTGKFFSRNTDCGVANLGRGNPADGFNAVDVEFCSALAHELGHNMGLAHARECRESTTPPLVYGYGYCNQGKKFRTAMAVCSRCFELEAVGRFSTPKEKFRGRPIGKANRADAVRALNGMREVIAAYRPCKKACSRIEIENPLLVGYSGGWSASGDNSVWVELFIDGVNLISGSHGINFPRVRFGTPEPARLPLTPGRHRFKFKLQRDNKNGGQGANYFVNLVPLDEGIVVEPDFFDGFLTRKGQSRVHVFEVRRTE